MGAHIVEAPTFIFYFENYISDCIMLLRTTNTTFPLLLNPSEDGSFFLEKDKFLKTVILRFKETLLKIDELKTGCYLSTGELITINIKVSNLFNKRNIEEVYEEIDKLKFEE